MFGPDYTAGCPSCSAIADGFNGITVHLANHDVMLWAVSRAPLAKLQKFKRRMGWAFPWASTLGSDFNFDFNVALTEEQQRAGGVEYNYRREAAKPLVGRTTAAWQQGPVAEIAAMTGTDVPTYTRERPGVSAFVREDGGVYHTYSTYARGLDGLWGMYQWLDRAPKGRKPPRRVQPALSPRRCAPLGQELCELAGGAGRWGSGDGPARHGRGDGDHDRRASGVVDR